MRALVLLLLLAVANVSLGQEVKRKTTFTEGLMQSTFKIVGPSARTNGTPSAMSFGTAFILGKPLNENSNRARFILITAKHVLDDINGDTAIVVVRVKLQDGTYTPKNHVINIRKSGVST